MSLLEVGKSCSVCSTIDFLPFTCPRCSSTLCRSHVQSHSCAGAGADDATEQNALAGPSSFRRKARCEMRSCEKPSIEAIGGREGDVLGDEIARAVRCHGCSGAYCTTHRSQTAHACSAPLDYTVRNDALAERRANARQVIAQKFPEHNDRVIPKPPPQRNVVKTKPKSPERLPPSLHPTPPADSGQTLSVPVKTKADKLRDIQTRKLRSLAVPLDSKMRTDGERRFFEWAIGSKQDIEVWQSNGKLSFKSCKVWVPQETPIGKILDILIDRSKTPRPAAGDIDERLQLVCLSVSGGDQKTSQVLSNESPASVVVEGSTVLLVSGGT